MVDRQQREQMTRFIAERLEERGIYTVLEQDQGHVLVAPPAGDWQLYIAAHAAPLMTLDQVRALQVQHRAEGIHTAHVFYLDGEYTLVRLGGRAAPKIIRSMKKYLPEKRLPGMVVHLRDLEKMVLGQLRSNGHRVPLAYYQPSTERLEESLRLYSMRPVHLDYSHITQDQQPYSHAKDGIALDYRLPELIAEIRQGDAIGILLCNLPQMPAALVHSNSRLPQIGKPKQLALFD